MGLEKRINLGVSTSIPISLAHDFSGNIVSKQIDGVTASLDCSPCNTNGVLDFEIVADLGQDITVTLIPTGVDASFTLDLTLSGELPNSFEAGEITLTTFTLPGGVSVAGVIDLGPALVVEAGASIGPVTAEATLSFGVTIAIPDDSKALLDISNTGKNSLTYFIPQFTPLGPTVDASVSVSGNVGPQVAIEFDATVVGKGVSAGLVLKAPEVDLELSAMASSAGVCGGTDVAGIQFNVGIGAELDGFAGVGAASDFPNSTPLLSTSTQLFSTCIGIAGASPPATTAITTTTSFASAASILTGASAAACTSLGQTVSGGLCEGGGPGGTSFVVDPTLAVTVTTPPGVETTVVTSGTVVITELTTVPVTTVTALNGGSSLITETITQGESAVARR